MNRNRPYYEPKQPNSNRTELEPPCVLHGHEHGAQTEAASEFLARWPLVVTPALPELVCMAPASDYTPLGRQETQFFPRDPQFLMEIHVFQTLGVTPRGVPPGPPRKTIFSTVSLK